MQVIIWAKYGLVYVNDNLITLYNVYYNTTCVIFTAQFYRPVIANGLINGR